MNFLSKLGNNVKLFFRRVRAALDEAGAKNPMHEVLGVTMTAAMDAFVFAYFSAMGAIETARWWQSETSPIDLNAIVQSPIRCLSTLTVVAFWIYVLSRWFRYIGWPRWWALPYVLLILCPWTWVFARRIQIGGDSLALLFLQSPVITVYVWRARNRNKRKL